MPTPMKMKMKTAAVAALMLLSQSEVHGFNSLSHVSVAAKAGRGGRSMGARITPRQPAAGSPASALSAVPGLEDFLFGVQGTASSWASVSLSDPTNLVSSLPIMYGAGLLTSFSPCVWGLLPLTVSYISAAAGDREDGATTLPTIAFAAGLASVFCSLGLVAASVGGAVFGSSGNTNALLPIASNAICCIMGLQLLDLVNLPLPSFQPPSLSPASNGSTDEPILLDGTGQILSSTSSSAGDNKSSERGSLVRTFFLGGSSALVASPCATPVLTSILAFVARADASHPLVGPVLLLFYTLGYATPLLLIAATGGQALVQIKNAGNGSLVSKISPWVTPLTAGVLLWYGTNGMLTAVLGDPSLIALAPIIE